MKKIFIKNGPHTFRDEKDLDEIKELLKKWIKTTFNVFPITKKMPQNFEALIKI